ncbi:MAG: putative collagen-binding domain-containing protein [Clostridia bacterium]|nr:putative collagen-binding domain-containing protein [Clostridia bacterium]MDD4679944.1 putative collagen-binding domain-containing protein [Clostridia bacterium]
MKHLRQLMESRPFFERIPDQSLLVDNYEGYNHQQAARGEDYAFIYAPHGIFVKVRLGVLEGKSVKVSWFNPRTGETSPVGIFKNTGEQTFIPPGHGREQDYVLILDSE